MEPMRFTDAEKAAFRAAYAPSANDEQWALFIQECERRALVPGTHVVFQTRNATEYNAQLNRRVAVQKVTMISTINALRLIAERTGKYDGHGPFVYYYGTENGELQETKIPRGKIPHAVSVEGFRKDWRVPLFATARYDAYVQTKDDAGTRKPTQMWGTRGEEQLAKCCEALMLRTVAPEECAGLYLTEELANDLSTQEEVSPTVAEKVTVPEATIAPAVNQSAASTEVTKSVTPKPEAATPKTDVVSTVTPAPVPSPTVVPVAPKAPEGSLFTEMNRPDPAHETRVFPPQPPNLGVKADDNVAAFPTPAVVVAAATSGADTPATSTQYGVFVTQRATKIIRDKLPKAVPPMKDIAVAVKNYLLKGANKAALNKISAVDFERLLSALESATPEQARDIVLAVK